LNNIIREIEEIERQMMALGVEEFKIIPGKDRDRSYVRFNGLTANPFNLEEIDRTFFDLISD
jgi:hypothetical protein